MTEIILKIPCSGLLIYYTDEEAGWGRSVINFFIEIDRDKEAVRHRYQLSRVGWTARPPIRGQGYRLFVYLKEGQDPLIIREALEAGGYNIVKEDYDPESGRLRIWFIDPCEPIRGEGSETRNLWT